MTKMDSEHSVSLYFILIAACASALCMFASIAGVQLFFTIVSAISFVSCLLGALFLWKICKGGW